MGDFCSQRNCGSQINATTARLGLASLKSAEKRFTQLSFMYLMHMKTVCLFVGPYSLKKATKRTNNDYAPTKYKILFPKPHAYF